MSHASQLMLGMAAVCYMAQQQPYGWLWVATAGLLLLFTGNGKD